MPDPPATVRFMLGTALYEGGAAAAGETQFQIVLDRQPHSSRARVALGEALLAQARYDEAAAVAAELASDDPLAVIGARTECFARIVAGDLDGAAASLQRARAAGMASEELDLFSAWRALAHDGHTEIVLSEQAVALLAVVLEALLRVQEFEAFELLVGLLERTPLDERERRHLLAEMYLRRGFLTSAADEWIELCQGQPDAAALLGLSRIAQARGMVDEANEFAAAAVAHDPDNAAAEHQLSALHAA